MSEAATESRQKAWCQGSAVHWDIPTEIACAGPGHVQARSGTRGWSQTMVPGSKASKTKGYRGYRYKADSEPDRGRARHVPGLHTTEGPAHGAETTRPGFF